MADFKLTISGKEGKSIKREVTGAQADGLLSKDIGENVAGDVIGLPGYEFEITGGSDNAGFPMRAGISGAVRKRIFTGKGVGFSGLNRWKKKQKGLKVKTTVAGRKIGPNTTQVNLKVLKQGAENLFLKEEKKEEAAAAPSEGQ